MASISVDDAPLSSIRNTNFELRLMARVLAGLFGAGATLALATILQFEPRVVEAFLAASRSGSARTDQPLAPV